MEKPQYELNVITENFIQVFGQVNGLITKDEKEICGTKCYHFSIKFFIGSKLFKITTSERDRTMTSLEKAKKRIDKTIDEILKKESI